MGSSKLGRLLVEENLLSEKDRRIIVNSCGASPYAFAKSILSLGLLDEMELTAFISQQSGLDIAPKELKNHIRSKALSAIEPDLLKNLEVIPVDLEDNQLMVACLDPLDGETVHQLEFFTNKTIVPIIATYSDLYESIQAYFPDFEVAKTDFENLVLNHVETAARHLNLVEGVESFNDEDLQHSEEFDDEDGQDYSGQDFNVAADDELSSSSTVEDEVLEDFSDLDASDIDDENDLDFAESEMSDDDDLSAGTNEMGDLDDDELSDAGDELSDDLGVDGDLDMAMDGMDGIDKGSGEEDSTDQLESADLDDVFSAGGGDSDGDQDLADELSDNALEESGLEDQLSEDFSQQSTEELSADSIDDFALEDQDDMDLGDDGKKANPKTKNDNFAEDLALSTGSDADLDAIADALDANISDSDDLDELSGGLDSEQDILGDSSSGNSDDDLSLDSAKELQDDFDLGEPDEASIDDDPMPKTGLSKAMENDELDNIEFADLDDSEQLLESESSNSSADLTDLDDADQQQESQLDFNASGDLDALDDQGNDPLLATLDNQGNDALLATLDDQGNDALLATDEDLDGAGNDLTGPSEHDSEILHSGDFPDNLEDEISLDPGLDNPTDEISINPDNELSAGTNDEHVILDQSLEIASDLTGDPDPFLEAHDTKNKESSRNFIPDAKLKESIAKHQSVIAVTQSFNRILSTLPVKTVEKSCQQLIAGLNKISEIKCAIVVKSKQGEAEYSTPGFSIAGNTNKKDLVDQSLNSWHQIGNINFFSVATGAYFIIVGVQSTNEKLGMELQEQGAKLLSLLLKKL